MNNINNKEKVQDNEKKNAYNVLSSLGGKGQNRKDQALGFSVMNFLHYVCYCTLI